MYRSYLWATALMLALSALVPPHRAHACSGPSCRPGRTLPSSGAIPANLIAFQWRPPSDGAGGGERSARLFAEEGGTTRELAVITSTSAEGLVSVRANAAVAAGTQLRLETTGQGCDGVSTMTARVVVSPEAPIPTLLGVVSLSASGHKQLQVGVQSGECFLPMQAAFAEFSLALSGEARPYADLMRYSLRIDGELTLEHEAPADWMTGNYIGDPPLGNSFLGRTTFRVFAPCDAGSRPEARQWPAPGKHTVSVVGTLPDGRSIESAGLSVDLVCATPDAGSSDGAPRDAGSATHAADASPEAAVNPEQEGVEETQVSPAQPASESPDDDDDDDIDGESGLAASKSTSCALQQRSSGPGLVATLPLLAIFLLRSRRQHALKR